MNIVIALDQSEFAPQIVEAVVERHWPAQTQFNIVSVVEPLQWEAASCIEWNQIAQEALNRRKLIAHQTLMEAKHRITHAVPGCQVHIETRHGKPTEQILNIATEWLADKIILGAHGHNTQHYFAGSVSRKIALRAPCSVEFVKLKSIPAEQQATRKKRSETTPATKK